MKSRALLAALAMALIASALAATSSSTTAPSRRILIVVRITDQGFRPLAQFSLAEGGNLKINPAAWRIPRGDYATFRVFNEGKRAHNFTILGRETGTLKPGARAKFNIYFKTRGNFRYSSSLDRGKKFQGFLSVT
jgi:plastocyanin